MRGPDTPARRTSRLARCLAGVAAALLATTATAASDPLLPDNAIATSAPAYALTRRERSMPPVLTARQRTQYQRIFLEIRAGRLTSARALLADMRSGPLDSVALGQILIRQGKSADPAELIQWLQRNPRSPDAPELQQLARTLGVTDPPPLIQPRALMPIRLTPAAVPPSVPPASAFEQTFADQAKALVKAEQPADVETMLRRDGRDLSPALMSEWAERAGWIAYLNRDDQTALRLAQRAADGAGEWAAMGEWVAGLASFRLQRWKDAAQHFDNIGTARTAADNLRAAGAYWAARAHLRDGHPELAGERLAMAVARDRTGFYGLLATMALGIRANIDWSEPDFIQADWTTLKHEPGARRAAALVEAGELGLADRELRHLAATAPVSLYEAVLRLAAHLNLPATQYWLASNPPPGAMPPMAARLPTPDWHPVKGWRIDPALVFAHALQESHFITAARSGAGAKGAMQIMPGTARDLARDNGFEHRDEMLGDPAYNIEYGQLYLEKLRDDPITGGRLPLVIAGYNAGPGAVRRWNDNSAAFGGDPLLYLESIPYWETRHYVKVVLRNYWLYQMKDAANGIPSLGDSLKELTENRWPAFPPRPATGKTR